MIQIAVIGGREAAAVILEKAEAVGRAIALRGAILLCGGLGGAMEAACRGAKLEGGFTVGILPTGRKEDANPYVDLVIPTDLGEARNAVIIHAADGVVAVGGGYGTLSEMAFALQRGVPIVSVESWAFDPHVAQIPDPFEAVAWLFGRVEGSQSPRVG